MSVIAEELFAASLGQPFVFAKIMDAKISDHDAACSLVVFSPKRPRQIEVRHSCCPSGILAISSFDKRKATKPATHLIPIFDL